MQLPMIEPEAFSFVVTALRAGINGFNHCPRQIILIIISHLAPSQVLRDEKKGVKTILKQVKMETTLLAHAQQLIYILLCLMPSQYQRDSLQALLGLFLEAQGHPLPQHSKVKSASTARRK